MKEEALTRAGPTEVGPDVWVVQNRGFASNTYLCRLSQPGRCIVIDPGLDLDAIEAAMHNLSLRPEAAFCTHGHFDHLGSAAQLQQSHGARLHMHRADLKVSGTVNFSMLMAGVKGRITVPTIDVLAEDGGEYLSGLDQVRFVHTPGHSPGSCLILFREFVFTGDTLFRDGLGLVDFPGVNHEQLRDSLSRVWDSIPEASCICPGHGGTGRFSDIKQHNHEVRTFLGLADLRSAD